jgi:hypothetical protein
VAVGAGNDVASGEAVTLQVDRRYAAVNRYFTGDPAVDAAEVIFTDRRFAIASVVNLGLAVMT